MTHFAVVKTGGKQYLVKENDEIVVDRIDEKEKAHIELDTVAVFDDAGTVELGAPLLDKKTKATVITHDKGEKLYISKFKSKVRYRRTTGFRSSLTKIKIGALN